MAIHIPKIIHQTYKTTDLPDKFRYLHGRIQQLHPDWKIYLWTDEDNRNLVREHYPYLLELYDSLPYNIMRVDIVRYMYMDVYGGFYCDLDYEVVRPFDEIPAAALVLPVSREAYENDYFTRNLILGNCIFGSVPGHVFWKDVLNDFRYHPPISRFANKRRILQLTGPEFITRIYFQSPEKYHALLPKRHLFHPDSALLRWADYRKTLLNQYAFGIHHNTNTWLKEGNSFANVVSGWMVSLMRRMKMRKMAAVAKPTSHSHRATPTASA